MIWKGQETELERKLLYGKPRNRTGEKTIIYKVKKQNWRKNYYMESQETELGKN